MRSVLSSAVLCLAVGLAGCAAVSPSVSKPEDLVSARAQERWAVLIKKDLDSAHRYLSAGSKAAFPLELYKAKIRPLNWRSVKVISVTCTDIKCVVLLELVVNDPRFGGDLKNVIDETWIKEEAGWGFVFNG